MLAYLDGKSFDHLYRKIGCAGSDIANLRKRIYGRELSIPLSVHHLEELMLDRQARPELRVARVKLMLSIGNFRRMVKPCEQLVADAMRGCLHGEDAPPLIDANLQNLISEGLSDLIESDGEELNEELMSALEEAHAQRVRFTAGLFEVAADIAAWAGAESSTDAEMSQFNCQIIERLALQARIATEVALQYQAILRESTVVRAYSAIVGQLVTLKANPRTTDFSGIVHAISAAGTVEQFVTEDRPLRAALTQRLAPMTVLGLPSFLQQIA
jgi:hypothetical protein